MCCNDGKNGESTSRHELLGAPVEEGPKNGAEAERSQLCDRMSICQIYYSKTDKPLTFTVAAHTYAEIFCA